MRHRIAQRDFSDFVPEGAPFMRRGSLTATQIRIIKALANGMTSKEIAEYVKLSVSTVEWHIKTLLQTFDARTRTHLVVSALCSGAVDLADVGYRRSAST